MSEHDTPEVTIIVPMMDRADDLSGSLPGFLAQDYPKLTVAIVDLGSEDDLPAVLTANPDERVLHIRTPRPRYFNFSRARNIGVRYTSGDLLFFLNGDNRFVDSGHLTRIVTDYLTRETADTQWYRAWRNGASLPPLVPRVSLPLETGATRKVYAHCLGSPLLVGRTIAQALGGFNENLTDWGFEDTDFVARLEYAGYGRIDITGLEQPDHDDLLRLRNFSCKDKARSWTRNRVASDRWISLNGIVWSGVEYPGRCAWVETNGRRHDGRNAPQQQWRMPGAKRPLLRRAVDAFSFRRKD